MIKGKKSKAEEEYKAEYEWVKEKSHKIIDYIINLYVSFKKVNPNMIISIHTSLVTAALLQIKTVWGFEAFDIFIIELKSKWDKVKDD